MDDRHSQLAWQNMLTTPLQRGETLNECRRYDTKLSDGNVLLLEPRVLWNTPLLPLLLPRLVVPVWVLSMDQMEIFDHLLYFEAFNLVQTKESC